MQEINLQPGPWSASTSLQRLNELQQAVQMLSREIARMSSQGRDFPGPVGALPDIFMGTIATGGSEGEADFTDARYWVTRSVAPAAYTGTSAQWNKFGPLLENLTTKEDPLNPVSNLPSVVIATNLSELPPGYAPGDGGDMGTHNLTDNTPVLVIGIPTRQNPTQRVYYFCQGGSGIENKVYRISAVGDADGYYFGYLQTRNDTPFDETGELVLSDYYVDTGELLVIQNIAESKDHNHCLPFAGNYWVIGWATGQKATGEDGAVYDLVQCDVSENAVGTYDCRTDFVQLDTDANVTSDVKAVLFRNEDFTLAKQPNPSWPDVMCVDWAGILVLGNDSLDPPTDPHTHIKAIQFSGTDSGGTGYSELDIAFTVTEATTNTNAQGDASCYVDYKTAVVTGKTFVNQMGTYQCGGSSPYYFTTDSTLYLGPGLTNSGASGDPLTLNLIAVCEPGEPVFAVVYNPASAASCPGSACQVGISVKGRQVNVATGSITSADSAGANTVVTDVVCNSDGTITVSYGTLDTIAVWVLDGT